jgi:hypothetical protein
MEVCFMLKKAEVPPTLFAGVIGRTALSANRAAKLAATWKINVDIKTAFLSIKRAADDFPRINEAKGHLK